MYQNKILNETFPFSHKWTTNKLIERKNYSRLGKAKYGQEKPLRMHKKLKNYQNELFTQFLK